MFANTLGCLFHVNKQSYFKAWVFQGWTSPLIWLSKLKSIAECITARKHGRYLGTGLWCPMYKIPTHSEGASWHKFSGPFVAFWGTLHETFKGSKSLSHDRWILYKIVTVAAWGSGVPFQLHISHSAINGPTFLHAIDSMKYFLTKVIDPDSVGYLRKAYTSLIAVIFLPLVWLNASDSGNQF